MNTEKIEALLERIALALEQLAGQANQNGLTLENPKRHPGVEIEAPKPSLSTLEPFLHSRGIKIKVQPALDPADRVIDSLSLYLGEHYNALSSLLKKIKRAMQSGASFTESLKDRPQQDISAVCQFCTRLYEVAFLEEYRYFRSPTYLIRAKTTTLPQAQRFFSGQWLERFVLQKVKAAYAQVRSEVTSRLSFEYLINPQITLPNGDDFELDVLAAIGTHVYWIEAKTGDYQQYVEKYARFARLLGVGPDHSFLVLTDISEDVCEKLSSLFPMTVCTLQSFEEKLLAVARNDTAQQSATTEDLPLESEP